MTHGSATNSHFPEEEISLTSSSATAAVFSYPASVMMMSYSVNVNAALHLGDAVPSHILIGTTKHSCTFGFVYQVLQRYK